jgi:hypothetical protein
LRSKGRANVGRGEDTLAKADTVAHGSDDVAYYAHRVIFNLANPGQIELKAPTNRKAKGFLMHSCDNRVCCNPSHLKVADLTENNHDAHRKGRVKHKTGGDHHRSVFTNDEIAQIFEMRKTGKSAREITKITGKKFSTVKWLLYQKSGDTLMADFGFVGASYVAPSIYQDDQESNKFLSRGRPDQTTGQPWDRRAVPDAGTRHQSHALDGQGTRYACALGRPIPRLRRR